LSDTRYTQLTKSLQELIQAYVEGRAGEAQESLHAFLTEFAADLIGDSREQVSVEEITGKLIDGIKEHLLAFQYLIDEIRKNGAYNEYIENCVSEGNCNNIPEFSINNVE